MPARDRSKRSIREAAIAGLLGTRKQDLEISRARPDAKVTAGDAASVRAGDDL